RSSGNRTSHWQKSFWAGSRKSRSTRGLGEPWHIFASFLEYTLDVLGANLLKRGVIRRQLSAATTGRQVTADGVSPKQTATLPLMTFIRCLAAAAIGAAFLPTAHAQEKSLEAQVDFKRVEVGPQN